MKRKFLVALSTMLAVLIVVICGVCNPEITQANEVTKNPNCEDISSWPFGDEYQAIEGKSFTLTHELIFEDSSIVWDKKTPIEGVTFIWEKLNKNTNTYEFVSNDFELYFNNVTKSNAGTYRFTIDYSSNEYQDAYVDGIKLNVTSAKELETSKVNNDYESKSPYCNLKTWSNVSISKSSYSYTGSKITPKVKVKGYDKNANKITLVKNRDYTVSYKNNKNPGKATITITGKGSYYGKRTLTFKIKVPKAKFSSLKIKNNKIVVKCAKIKNVSGYQLRYAKSNMKLNKSKKSKFTTMKAQLKNKFTTKKLSKGNYFVQIRTYVKVGKKKVYSSWQTYDLMAVIGGKMKPEKGRLYEKIPFEGKLTKFYMPKYVSDKLKVGYQRCWIRSDSSVRQKRSCLTKHIVWGLYDKSGTRTLYYAIADVNGNVIEEIYYE